MTLIGRHVWYLFGACFYGVIEQHLTESPDSPERVILRDTSGYRHVCPVSSIHFTAGSAAHEAADLAEYWTKKCHELQQQREQEEHP